MSWLKVNFNVIFCLQYPAWQRCGMFVVDSEVENDPDTRTCLPTEQRYVLYENSWKKKGGKGKFLW